MKTRRAILFLLAALCLPMVYPTSRANAQGNPFFTVRRVLLLSIDGFHAIDLAYFVRSHPDSALAQLWSAGVTYTQASCAKPSNSFPGLLSIVTGGSPRSTGVWYEGAYARTLSPPGSNCKTVGTEVVWDGSLDKDRKAIDGGGGIDPAKLPLDPSRGCVPVYPHSFLRVNTIFEVVHSAGMRTGWIDKHQSYEMVNGPSGQGVDDFFGAEIGASGGSRGVAAAEAYDDMKVQAILNEIDGKDHTGTKSVGVPALFGMSFQEVRFAQATAGGGYTDASGTPSAALLETISHTDQSIGKLVSALKARGLLDSTLIVISAKHGQAPIDVSKRRLIPDTIIPDMINRVESGLIALAYQDGDLCSIWLTDQSKTGKVVEILSQPANQAAAGIEKILWGESLKLMITDPLKDNRAPDIVVIPNLGGIYAAAEDKVMAAHGGFHEEDTHVALLIANPGLAHGVIKTPVETTQIAPTILRALGLEPGTLQAVQIEKTGVLPGLFVEAGSWLRMLSSR